MKTILITTVIIFVILAGTFAICLEKFDDGYILVIGPHVYDPVGVINDLGNKLVRDCSTIISPGFSSEDAIAVSTHLQNLTHSKPKLNLFVTSELWAIVEAEFQDREPGSFLLQKLTHGYKTVTVWGGSAAPFKNGPAIREMFMFNAPASPKSLIRCYDPFTPPFGSGNDS